MSIDLDVLFEEASITPSRSLDLARVEAGIARRRNVRRVRTSVVAVLAVALMGDVLGALPSGDQPRPWVDEIPIDEVPEGDRNVDEDVEQPVQGGELPPPRTEILGADSSSSTGSDAAASDVEATGGGQAESSADAQCPTCRVRVESGAQPLTVSMYDDTYGKDCLAGCPPKPGGPGWVQRDGDLLTRARGGVSGLTDRVRIASVRLALPRSGTLRIAVRRELRPDHVIDRVWIGLRRLDSPDHCGGFSGTDRRQECDAVLVPVPLAGPNTGEWTVSVSLDDVPWDPPRGGQLVVWVDQPFDQTSSGSAGANPLSPTFTGLTVQQVQVTVD